MTMSSQQLVPLAPLPFQEAPTQQGATQHASQQDDVSASAEPPPKVCCKRGCLIQGPPLLDCANPSCTKATHFMCYQWLIQVKNKNPNATDEDLQLLPDGKVACTKACHKKMMKAKERDEAESGRSKWHSDAKPETPHLTSMKILLDWMTEEGNYSKYRGKDNGGKKKKKFHEELAAQMSEATTSIRDDKQVGAKIQHLEKKWREAHNFATSETGAGMEQKDFANGTTTFRDIVLGKCEYYYELLEIFQDRASAQPKVNSDQLAEYGTLDQVDTQQDTQDTLSVLSGDSETGGDDEEESPVVPHNVPHNVGGTQQSVTQSSVAQSSAKSTATKRKQQQQRNRSSVSIMNDDQMAMLLESTRSNSLVEKKRLKLEEERMQLEREKMETSCQIEREKLAAMKTSGPSKLETEARDVNCTMDLIANYKKLKEGMNMSDKMILAMFPGPGMKHVIDTMNGSAGDNGDSESGSTTSTT